MNSHTCYWVTGVWAGCICFHNAWYCAGANSVYVPIFSDLRKPCIWHNVNRKKDIWVYHVFAADLLKVMFGIADIQKHFIKTIIIINNWCTTLHFRHCYTMNFGAWRLYFPGVLHHFLQPWACVCICVSTLVWSVSKRAY